MTKKVTQIILGTVFEIIKVATIVAVAAANCIVVVY